MGNITFDNSQKISNKVHGSISNLQNRQCATVSDKKRRNLQSFVMTPENDSNMAMHQKAAETSIGKFVHANQAANDMIQGITNTSHEEVSPTSNPYQMTFHNRFSIGGDAAFKQSCDVIQLTSDRPTALFSESITGKENLFKNQSNNTKHQINPSSEFRYNERGGGGVSATDGAGVSGTCAISSASHGFKNSEFKMSSQLD